MKPWFVYMLRCADASLYTGITTDVARRLREHNAGTERGSRYTCARRPVVVVYLESADNRSVASKREAAIRRLDRRGKLALCDAE